jgi:hypothetical protein
MRPGTLGHVLRTASAYLVSEHIDLIDYSVISKEEEKERRFF